MSKKRKRKRVARDKQTDLPKKYLSGFIILFQNTHGVMGNLF